MKRHSYLKILFILYVFLIPLVSASDNYIIAPQNYVDMVSQLQQPEYISKLRPYEISKDHDIWHASDPASYIDPDNEWVKYYASQLYIDFNGIIRYKNQKTPIYIDKNGNVRSWSNKIFENNYETDDVIFNNPPNADLWQNSDYYLTNNRKGDCEDFAIAITSMFLSGEVSILDEKNKFVKQLIPAKVVLGTTTYLTKEPIFDAWSEYTVYGKTYISNSQIQDEYGRGITLYIDSNKSYVKSNFIKEFEFDNKHFGIYI